MKAHEFELVKDVIDNEGFEYTFINYSDFEDIDDELFHKLRIAYVEAAEALAEYVGV